MTVAVPQGDFARVEAKFDAGWKLHAGILAGAWLALLLLFRRDALDLATIYWTNTTFGHCLFIAPVIAWLVWQRRSGLALVRPQGWWPGLVLVAAGGLGWLLGDAAGVALFRHAGLVLMLQGAAVSVLGLNVSRALLFPIAYMGFLVPFGDFLEGPLQSITVAMVMPMLHLFGVPATVDGVLITTSNGYFEVAEACSGAKFVIAMIAFGVLVANVCYVSWPRRAAFLAMALVVPVIANGLRAFGTIYAAWWTSVEAATGMDHIVYGWFFFAAVMAVVLAIGWKWFDRDPDAAWFDPLRLQAPVAARAQAAVTALLALTVASLFLGWSSWIAARASPLPTQFELPQIPGWQRVGPSTIAPWSPNYPGADHLLIGHYADPQGRSVDLAVAVYGSQHEGKELVGFGIGAIRENDRWVRIADLPELSGGHALRMTGPGRVERVTVSWYRVGETLTGSDKRVKFETLKTKLLGGDQAAVAVLVSAEQGRDESAQTAIGDFLNALGPVDAFADRMAGR
ncbi:exosortase A [Sphingomonas psychrotolerans]|uniref:EpsI family protein n=1 Tax=Sphingomonas psychrotolerans TaxID=1327635 RepID=A0A2K8MFQ4_9SPHN|nr:exosortase A [Sphingomonas psychrotolerans]ATY31804.1 EpsI family protein [Sphingomonas psychrotolerans]